MEKAWIFFRPLIDELKLLWHEKIWTHDANSNQNFQMKAALLWTISDFPAYGMLFGWSTHGRMSCPYCMKIVGPLYCSMVGRHLFFIVIVNSFLLTIHIKDRKINLEKIS